MNRFSLALVLLLLLGGTLVSMLRVDSVRAAGPIFIRANGTVDPVTANITRNGDLYTLTSNITSDGDGIVIERNNTVVDGAGFTIRGAGSNASKGVSFPRTTNVTVRNVKISEFGIGVYLNETSMSTVSGNEIAENSVGVSLSSCSSNSIQGNNITSNAKYGILATLYADYNTFFRNNIAGSYSGFRFDYSSSHNLIYENDITNNQHGILFLLSSSDNWVLHNNLVGNSVFQAFSDASTNVWDDGYPSCGNYWSNCGGIDLHSGVSQIADGRDGVGDTSYSIFVQNKDQYPLMGMFRSFDATPSYQVTVVSNSTIEDFVYYGSNGTIKMHVTNSALNQVYGFCRVSIPHAVINGTYYVYADGEEPSYVNVDVADNGTHRWLYFIYPYWTNEVIIRQEPVLRDTTSPVISNVHQQPTEDNVHPTDRVVIYADVTDDISGVKQVTLNYTVGNGTWVTANMMNLAGNTFNATIPGFPLGTNVTYVIRAEDNANNSITTEEMGYMYQYPVIPEFASALIMPLFMATTLIAVTIYQREHRPH
jgi:parallel beta-helix repeat protein